MRRVPIPARWVMAAAVAMLLAAASPAQADDCPFADAQAAQATPDQLDQATVCLLGQERAAYGLAPLAVGQPLGETATRYAGYMIANERFAHIDLAGHNVLDRVLIDHPGLADRLTSVGENLGWGTNELSTPRAMVAGWMNSAEHRANILYPGYQLIGVGTADGAPQAGESNALTYAIVFGEVTSPPMAIAGHPTRRHHRRHRGHAARRRAARR